jgi:hypothetical protein
MTPAPVGLRCPEHAGKAQGVRRVAQVAEKAATGAGSRRANAVTLTLIAINVGVYLAELAMGGQVNGTGNWIYDHGVLYGPYVANGDWYRLLTAAFLHYGPIHLLLNMYGLYLAGSLLEAVIGRWRFLLLYIASGLAGSAGALIASYYGGTVGASGAIFGIFGALFVLDRRSPRRPGCRRRADAPPPRVPAVDAPQRRGEPRRDRGELPRRVREGSRPDLRSRASRRPRRTTRRAPPGPRRAGRAGRGTASS